MGRKRSELFVAISGIELDRQQMVACTYHLLRLWRKDFVASQTVEVDAAGVYPAFQWKHYQSRKTTLVAIRVETAFLRRIMTRNVPTCST